MAERGIRRVIREAIICKQPDNMLGHSYICNYWLDMGFLCIHSQVSRHGVPGMFQVRGMGRVPVCSCILSFLLNYQQDSLSVFVILIIGTVVNRIQRMIQFNIRN